MNTQQTINLNVFSNISCLLVYFVEAKKKWVSESFGNPNDVFSLQVRLVLDGTWLLDTNADEEFNRMIVKSKGI